MHVLVLDQTRWDPSWNVHNGDRLPIVRDCGSHVYVRLSSAREVAVRTDDDSVEFVSTTNSQ